MEKDYIKVLCEMHNPAEAARILYEEGEDGSNEGEKITKYQVWYDLTEADAEEVFAEIIKLEEQDGIERDEFGNVIDLDSDFGEEE